MPSRTSWLACVMCWQRASSSSACTRVTDELASRSRFERPSASVGPEARRRPQSSATASSSPAGDDLVHEADALGLLRVDHVGEERELLGLVEPDPARQQPGRAPVEREPALGEDLREARAIARHHEIARQREAEAHPDADAVDLGERRLGHALEPQDDVADDAHLLDDRLERAAGETLSRRVAGEIGARGEVAARAGEHQRAIVRIGSDLRERAIQLDPHLCVDRVLLLGPVERDRDQAVAPLDADRRHLAPPSSPATLFI